MELANAYSAQLAATGNLAQSFGNNTALMELQKNGLMSHLLVLRMVARPITTLLMRLPPTHLPLHPQGYHHHRTRRRRYLPPRTPPLLALYVRTRRRRRCVLHRRLPLRAPTLRAPPPPARAPRTHATPQPPRPPPTTHARAHATPPSRRPPTDHPRRPHATSTRTTSTRFLPCTRDDDATSTATTSPRTSRLRPLCEHNPNPAPPPRAPPPRALPARARRARHAVLPPPLPPTSTRSVPCTGDDDDAATSSSTSLHAHRLPAHPTPRRRHLPPRAPPLRAVSVCTRRRCRRVLNRCLVRRLPRAHPRPNANLNAAANGEEQVGRMLVALERLADNGLGGGDRNDSKAKLWEPNQFDGSDLKKL
ncbi:hypothetical protein JB92DRAFT_3104069 [Gautieria morchelliformis]|nr:hypothetical protein JB92DRAFT_3104069 [Gautieria morchelliformis]